MLLRGKQASGLLTQQKMLRAAVKLFLEKRYEGTTTAEIARAAGMPPSSFFRAFPVRRRCCSSLKADVQRAVHAGRAAQRGTCSTRWGRLSSSTSPS